LEIKGIDFSQPGYKEMFANYGLTAMAAIGLEKTIWLLITAVDNLGSGKVSDIQEIQKQLEQHKCKPLGPLIKALHKRLEVNIELSNDLKNARKKRNFIIHHFFTERIDNLNNKPNELSNELRPIRDFFPDTTSKIDALLGKIWRN
jgi:hypothetical protein